MIIIENDRPFYLDIEKIHTLITEKKMSNIAISSIPNWNE